MTRTDGATFRSWRPGRPVDVRATLSALRHGRSDPCHRVGPEGTVWRATGAGDGAVLLKLVTRPALGEIEATGWGPGAAAALAAVPDLLGARDDPTGFAPRPQHHQLVSACRLCPGWRVPRTGAVFEALAAAAVEQRVTGKEAHRSWRLLVGQFGEPAPGPGAAAGMRLPPTPAAWRAIPSWVWLRAGVDLARRQVVLAAAAVAGRLEQTVDLDPATVSRRLRSLPGVGIWTAAEVRQRAHGDADAFSFHDYHVAGMVSWALTGEKLDDVGCAEVIECYRGHRYRVQRLLELAGTGPPRHGPRFSLPTHLPAS